MRCVASYTILLKPYIVYINTMMSVYKKIGYPDAMEVSIDRKGCTILIFMEIGTKLLNKTL